jgi:hypothetical protein
VKQSANAVAVALKIGSDHEVSASQLTLKVLLLLLSSFVVIIRLLASQLMARRMLPTAMLTLILRYCGRESHSNVMMMRAEMKLDMMILVAASKHCCYCYYCS